MNGNKEFIESLSRMIKTKRVALGLDSDITEIKSLSKYIDIKSVKLPAKFDDFKSVRFKYVSREFDMFQSTIYTSHRDCERDSYVFSKIISEVSKKVATDMLNLSEQEDCENKINGYIKQYTDFNNLKVEMLDDTYENMDILDNVLSKLKKSTFTKVKVTNNNPEAKNKEFVGILDSKINNKIAGHWYSRMNHSKEIHVRDFVWIVAVGRVIKECCKYFRKDVDRAREILFRKMYPNRIFEEQLSLEETIKRMDSSFICSEMEKVRYYQLPESLMGFINHCMASMVEETGVILEYEAGIRIDMDSKYASSYETKANITKKMQGFMSNNNFLNMFGYVEADDMCDLEKLNQISNEFIEYTELLPVPVSKSNSLRFRRLGKNKAAGLYFPFAKCLCVD
ncbi:MAG: hypothetical protein IJ086_04010, partial [Clostridium sp.]|nr:hypothetical protein [Clostridium sp.]